MPFSKLPDVELTLRSPSKKKPSALGPFCTISKRNGTSALLATMTASHNPVMPGVVGTGVREHPAATATSISAQAFTILEFMAKACAVGLASVVESCRRAP